MQTNSNTSVRAAGLPKPVTGFGSFASRTWMSVFPFASLALFATQPSAITTFALSLASSFAMAALAHASVHGEEAFDSKLSYVRVLAPVQSALLIWLAVYIGHDVAGTSLIASSLAAFAALGAFLVADALLSGATLFAAERGRGAMGTSIACLISEKYAGLFGKID